TILEDISLLIPEPLVIDKSAQRVVTMLIEEKSGGVNSSAAKQKDKGKKTVKKGKKPEDPASSESESESEELSKLPAELI
ncbi:hypothetical protein Dimus_022154, partial [Dionaea muscipula]